MSRAVVIVSGGAAVSPFTTPYQACSGGLAAGNTDTYLREGLLAAGHHVFTSPARAGAGQVTEDTGWNGFSGGPAALPAEMTVNSVGAIDDAGENLARFFGYLVETHGVVELDVVAHSMGGLFSRAAFRILRDTGSALVIRTLTTLGTPWQGGFTADYCVGDLTVDDCNGDPVCEASMMRFAELFDGLSEGAGEQVAARYLTGPDGWNEQQGDVLAGIPVVLVAGDALSGGSDDRIWPNDGLVALRSALARDVSERVLAHAMTHTFHDVHSIYVANLLGLPPERALTWDPDVLAVVREAIEHPEPATAPPSD
jgi:pimeloyl-ACP methyl ester carboxylesterase